MFEKKLNCLCGSKFKDIPLTTSGNGSLKLTSSGDPFVDQFAFITNYRQPRPYSEISKDMEILWQSNPLNAMKLTFYMRMITRKVELADGSTTESTQRGQGLKYEPIMRMIWVAIHYPEVFYNNLPLFISIGCWKDIIKMLSIDLQYNGYEGRLLDWEALSDFILAGLENPITVNLVKKYLPTIKVKSKCHTIERLATSIIGKYLAHRLFGKGEFSPLAYNSTVERLYRKLKSSGTAHQWQQQISKGNFNIDFSKVHGRALLLLVSSKYLKNHNLEKVYEDWILSQPIAKFTGYVYELFKNLTSNTENYKKITINKQFANLVETAKVKEESSFIVVRDISASMSSTVPGTGISSGDIAKAMALYFSYQLKGRFANSYIVFSRKPSLRYWVGDSPTVKYLNDTEEFYGNTNFLAIADLFIEIFKSGVRIEDFPKGILLISDGELDGSTNSTTFETFLNKLTSAGFPKEYVDNFKIVLWDIPNMYYSNEIRPKFESDANHPNFYYMSGLDPAGISFLLGNENKSAPKTPRELFEAAMNQELLNLIVI